MYNYFIDFGRVAEVDNGGCEDVEDAASKLERRAPLEVVYSGEKRCARCKASRGRVSIGR